MEDERHENNKDAVSIDSEKSSPTSNAEYIMVDDNASDASSTTKISFSDVQSDDYMPTMGQNEHGQDVSELVAEAQMDDFITNYYANENDQHDGISTKVFTVESDSSLHSSDEEKSNEGVDAKDACVLFHGITYLGSSNIDAPMSDLELKRSISILRDHMEGCIDIILSVSLNHPGMIRLIDPDSRTDIATYSVSSICFWGKGDGESIEKDCLAFNICQGKDVVTYHCHVFKCHEEDDVQRILHSLAQTIKTDQKKKQLAFPSGRRASHLDPNNLTFKFDISLDVWEEDGKGSYQTVARDRTHFKLRKNLQRKLVFIIEQTSNRELKIERCFGLLLAQGRDVSEEDFHLLRQVESNIRPKGKKTVISGNWDSSLDFWKILNTDPGKDNKVYMTVAADLIFEDVKEPVRFIKEAKVRVFPTNEKFWNPAKPRIQEEFILQLKENFTDEGEKWFEKESLQSASEIAKYNSLKTPSSSNSFTSIWKNNKNNKSTAEYALSQDTEVISGPEDEEDDEPLLSGSGEFERSYSEGEMTYWSDVMQKWKDLDTKPKSLLQSIRRGIPDPFRGQIWQMLSGMDNDSELLSSYPLLYTKDSQQEQVILWDVTRTFPAHEYFRESNGKGQNALYNISKAYSNYDEEVGYCQGLSFIIATFLLYLPEEQTYCLLVKLMYNYGHRELFINGFAMLHQWFHVLDRVLEDTLQDLFQHFHNNNIESHMYASQWFLTLFTAKFPLSLVYNIIDIVLYQGLDVIFQIAAALLKIARKDLLGLDFEGILKYFRINMPKYYMSQSHRNELIKTIYEIKLSKKKIMKYKQEYIQFKEEQELKQDPVERLSKENNSLQLEKLRLERENDSLAYEVVNTQVSMQEIITDREEKLNDIIKEMEQLKNHLAEAEEENERLKMEEARIKDMWRVSTEKADEDRKGKNIIISDYKQIITRLQEDKERLEKNNISETELLKSQLASCENCTNALLKNIYPDKDGDEDSENKTIITRLVTKEDHEEQMRSLEEELIKTKVALAEEKNRADEIEMKLHNVISANEKPWYKKVNINNKR